MRGKPPSTLALRDCQFWRFMTAKMLALSFEVLHQAQVCFFSHRTLCQPARKAGLSSTGRFHNFFCCLSKDLLSNQLRLSASPPVLYGCGWGECGVLSAQQHSRVFCGDSVSVLQCLPCCLCDVTRAKRWSSSGPIAAQKDGCIFYISLDTGKSSR